MPPPQALRASLAAPPDLPEPLAAALGGFLDEYLGSGEGAAVPFGGRDDELARLDRWLDEPDLPFALITSEAGYGKSALLARWAAAIALAGRQVVFVPISIRFGTCLRAPALKLLATSLAAALGRRLPETQDAASLRAECEAALTSVGDGPGLVVVLDAVDEAVGWQCGRDLDLVGPSSGRGLKILLSARSTGERGGDAWRARLGLPEGRYRAFELGTLDGAAVRAVLRGAPPGGPLEANAEALADELFRLSGGDPLLLRLYLAALRDQLPSMTPSDLPRLPPGLDAWFSRWWAQSRLTWGGAPATEACAEALFDLLATALGPLSRDDLGALADFAAPSRPGAFNAALCALRPLLVGDGVAQPFALSHPRLRHFRLDQMGAARHERTQRYFLDYGGAQFDELLAGAREPARVSPYLLRHYGAHLALAGREGQARAWALVCEPWQRAWEALEGTFDGFLSDVDRAAEAAELAASEGDREAALAAARCGLVFSSIASLSYRLPPNLAGHLVEQAIWSPAVAVARARLPEGGYRPETLGSLAPFLDATLARKALASCAAHPNLRDLNEAEAFVPFAVRLVELFGPEGFSPALEGFEAGARALMAAASWPSLPPALWPLCARYVREGAKKVSHCSYAASVVFASLPILPTEEREGLIRSAIDTLDEEDFGLDNEQAAFLGAVGEWTYGLRKAEEAGLPYPRAQAFAHVAPYLPEPMRESAYTRWFEAYREAIADNFSFVALKVPRGLGEGLRDELLAFVRARPEHRGSARPLLSLAYQFRELVPEALRAARALDGAHGALARLSLAYVLEGPARHAIAAESYRSMLACIDAGKGEELSRKDEYWPQGPDDKHWTYIGRRRRPEQLLIEPLRFMAPAARARCVRELFARFRRIDDGSTLLAAVATTAERATEPEREAWAPRLLARLHPHHPDPRACAALAALSPGADHAGLAEAAWRHDLRESDDEATGQALAALSPALDQARRSSIQIEAMKRWLEPRPGVFPNGFFRGLGRGLFPEAMAWLLEHGANDSRPSYLVDELFPALDDETRRRETTRCLHHLPPFWPDAVFDPCVKTFSRYAKGVGEALAAIYERSAPLRHLLQSVPPEALVPLAWALDPLLTDGFEEHARDLRARLDEPVAAWIADLATAHHDRDGARGRATMERALADLAALAARRPQPANIRVLDAFEAALRWATPHGLLPAVLAAAERLPAREWLQFAHLLHRQGFGDVFDGLLSEARVASLIDALLDTDLAPTFWAPYLSEAGAAELWQRFWRRVRSTPRSRLFWCRGWSPPNLSLVALLPLALRAGGPTLPGRLAATVLEVGDWFP
jgi:hypothetical protein